MEREEWSKSTATSATGTKSGRLGLLGRGRLAAFANGGVLIRSEAGFFSGECRLSASPMGGGSGGLTCFWLRHCCHSRCLEFFKPATVQYNATPP